MLPLKDLPNRNGFRFTGISALGVRVPCIVQRGLYGKHTVRRGDSVTGPRVPLVELLGWEPRA